MNKDVKCKNCKSDIVVVENKLFFSEEKSETEITCPICSSILDTLSTDGWFFIQTKTDYLKELEIEKNKEKLTYPMP
jgi:transcription initiation factor IIE alpha subunit